MDDYNRYKENYIMHGKLATNYNGYFFLPVIHDWEKAEQAKPLGQHTAS